jgi:Adenylate and Guanylate cyclase catalytic domain
MAVLLSDWLVIAESIDPQPFRGDVGAPKKRPHTFRNARTPFEGCGRARRGYGRAVATAGKQLPEGTVTFLFTDIEGSTPLLERLGAERYRELLEVHRQLLRDAVAAAGGVEIRAEADSFFAAFPRADGAASAAVAAQRALEAHDWHTDGSVRVRIGLHTGEATLAGDDYVGLAVHQRWSQAHRASAPACFIILKAQCVSPRPSRSAAFHGKQQSRLSSGSLPLPGVAVA